MNQFKKENKKLNKLRGIFFQIGLIVAGGLTLVAFEWTSPNYMPVLYGEVVDEIEWDIDPIDPFKIIEDEPEKVKKKVEKPVVKTHEFKPVENNEVIPEEKEDKEKEPYYDPNEWKEPKEEVKEEEAPRGDAGRMPHYDECAAMDEFERTKCTQQKMFKHFAKKIKVPATIKMKGKAVYKAYVYFEVNKKGEIVNVKLQGQDKNKIPRELERQAFNAVQSLPQLNPAKHNGRVVAVKYTVPIKFTVN